MPPISIIKFNYTSISFSSNNLFKSLMTKSSRDISPLNSNNINDPYGYSE